ncbi:MAG TPA: tetratricopeptide repeat protein, partial [Bacteroidales bacterium]|nr:tetratricopeptide repeat protein [Bacteroidales bacterium]
MEKDSSYLDFVFQDTSLSTAIQKQANALRKSVVEDAIFGRYHVLSNNLQQLAFIHLRLTDYEQSLEYLSMAYDYCQRFGTKKNQAVVLRRLGTVYTEMELLEKGMGFLKRSQQMFRESGDTVNYEFAKSLKNVGLNYSRQKDYRKALTYFKQALQLAKILDMPVEAASSYANMSGAYIYLNSPDSVLYLLDKAERIFSEHNDSLGLGTVYNNRGEYYMRNGEYEKALDMFTRSNVAYSKVHENRFRVNALKNIALMHDKLGHKDKSVDMYQNYIQANATLMRNKLNNTIQNMDARYHFVEQRRRVENQLALSQKQAKVKSYQVILLGGLLIVLVVGSVVYTRQRRVEAKLVKMQLEQEKNEKSDLRSEINFKDREMEGFALNITHKNRMLEKIKESLDSLKDDKGTDTKKVRDIKFMIDQFLHNDKELDDFHKQVEILQQNFLYILKEKFPQLSENETRLCVLL